MVQRTAVVIGSGLGGIASACRLRALDYQVTLLEALPDYGGSARVFEQDGCRFDAGPTVITAHYLFDELFQLFGEQRAALLPFHELNPWYRFCYKDGSSLDYGNTKAKIISAIEQFSAQDAGNYSDFLDYTKQIFDIAYCQLADQPFHRLSELCRQLPHFIRLKSHQSVYQVTSRFFRHPKIRHAFSVPPLLVGGNPLTTTSIYLLIHYLEHHWGVHYAQGGTGALIAALIALLRRQGVQCMTHMPVTAISASKHRRYAVQTASRTLHCDCVVANINPLQFFKLFSSVRKQSFFLRQCRQSYLQSMSLFIYYFGTSRRYPAVAHHTIFLQDDMMRGLKAIFRHQLGLADFNFYLHRPSATDPSVAPPGCDSFYVLVPVPNQTHPINWQQMAEPFTQALKKELAESLLPDLEQVVFTEKIITPDYFSQQLMTQQATAFGLQPIFYQSAWFRYHNRPFKNESVYLVGANTHPGAGMPGVLNSAKVIEHLVTHD